MAFEDVYLVSDKLDLVTGDDVTVAETRLGARFPDGYREYVNTLGAGDYNDYISVYLPSQILGELVECQSTWKDFASDSYEDGFDLLPLPRLVESIILDSTADGDQIVFHPDTRNALYVLPRQDVRIYKVGSSLNEALEWLLDSGVLRQRETTRVLTASGQFAERKVRYFEPYGDREKVEFGEFGTTRFEQIREFLVTLAQSKHDGIICVSHTYMADDSNEHEWLQLFVKEYYGIIRCVDFPEEQGRISVFVTYDIERQTDNLRQVLTYFDDIAALRIDPAESGAPVWDRENRVWRGMP